MATAQARAEQRRRHRGAADRRCGGDARRPRRARGKPQPRLEFRGEFLHAFMDTERVKSNKPVTLIARQRRVHGRQPGLRQPRPRAASCDGRVRGTLQPRGRAGADAHGQPLVFITGASSGIGQALAWRYHQAGWRLALVARRTGEIAALGAGAGHRRRPLCASTAPTWRDTDSIVAAGPRLHRAAGRAGRGDRQRRHQHRRGHRRARGPGRDRAHLRDQQRRPGRDLPSLHRRRWCSAAAARWWASPAWPASAACRDMRAYCASKAAVISYCESLRGELRAARRAGGDDLPGLRRHAAHAAEPLRHAVPDEGRRTSPTRPSAPSRRARSYRVIPWQMGVVAKLLRVLPNRAVRPAAGRPAAQASAAATPSRLRRTTARNAAPVGRARASHPDKQ